MPSGATLRQNRGRLFALIAAALCLASACNRRAPSPEDEIRAFLARAEQAARDRDVGAVKRLIADDYADAEGRDKRTIAGIAAYHFMQGGSLHIATRLHSVTFPQRDVAKAVVIAAVGRTEIDLTSLPQVDADAYRFALDLRRGDDGWQVTSASWREARVDDLR